ncbi:uncharacterized protein BX664DRAFT_375325 [Halteromyces radiatus]|uniref:uncharacterized protein n=1 Tax=Halteromyces radiatus TaxID=101107 RepID=UPI00221E7123|nr:uncharacterized protein BX664DRAFT_375325 [Halteromyces radiatus]KAI8084800.1 hypothetical protein BX664DRAFT_375325 [Halteromyces radiatus]
MFSLRYRHNTTDILVNTTQSYFTSHLSYFLVSICFDHTSMAFRCTTVYHVGTMIDNHPSIHSQSELILAQQINWTLRKQFYIGSSPPLATLMYTSLAKLTGYHGNESILYAGQILKEFPLATLRYWTMIISALTIPAIYTLICILGRSHTTALLTSSFLLLENSMVIQSRYISENPLCILFCCFAGCSFFYSQPTVTSRQCLTGILLGCALCTKWQGGTTIAFFLVIAIYEWWQKIGDPATPMKQSMVYIGVQCLTLLILPMIVYVLLFQCHFQKIPGAGDHDLFLASDLRYSLKGNTFDPVQQSVAFGSHVVLKHVGTNNGYLHSDNKIFESGSHQNQVTVYPYEDLNNIWVIQKVDGKIYDGPPDYLRNNYAFKLEHYASTRKLHSHDQNAPIHSGDGFYEVTSYGDPSVVNDGNDLWWIRIVEDDDGYDTDSDEPIHALTTRFRLLHQRGCYLSSHYQPLPLADGAQQEVTCMAGAKSTVSAWVFEYTHHPDLEGETPMIQYEKPTFFSKFQYVHHLMKNYKKVVYDRLSSVEADDVEYVNTMMYYDELPQPWTWLRRLHAQLIWDDLTGRSVYIILHPLLRHITLVTLVLIPIIAFFSSLFSQLQWKRASMCCQQFLAGNEIQTATIALVGVVFHTAGIGLWPAHTITLSDMFPCLMYGTIAFTSLLEWLIVSSKNHHHCRSMTDVTNHHNKLTLMNYIGKTNYLWMMMMMILILLHVGQFLSWSSFMDGSSAWTSTQCKMYDIKGMDCDKYPLLPTPSTRSLTELIHKKKLTDDDDDDDDVEKKNDMIESRFIMMPGSVLRYDFDRGQEIKAEMDIASKRESAYIEAMANLTLPSFRYMRPMYTPGPNLEDITSLRHYVYLRIMKDEGYDDDDVNQAYRQPHRKLKGKGKKKKNKKGKKVKGKPKAKGKMKKNPRQFIK